MVGYVIGFKYFLMAIRKRERVTAEVTSWDKTALLMMVIDILSRYPAEVYDPDYDITYDEELGKYRCSVTISVASRYDINVDRLARLN